MTRTVERIVGKQRGNVYYRVETFIAPNRWRVETFDYDPREGNVPHQLQLVTDTDLDGRMNAPWPWSPTDPAQAAYAEREAYLLAMGRDEVCTGKRGCPCGRSNILYHMEG